MGFSASERMAVWQRHCGNEYDHKCLVKFCQNMMNPFQFDVGHVIAKAKGGSNCLSNLKPICAKCNKSMGTMSMDEYEKVIQPTPQVTRDAISEYEGKGPKWWKIWRSTSSA